MVRPRRCSDRRRLLLLVGTLLIGLAPIACSPEASRTRGGGPGADVGNRGKEVRIHEGSRPFYQTPLKGAGR